LGDKKVVGVFCAFFVHPLERAIKKTFIKDTAVYKAVCLSYTPHGIALLIRSDYRQ
jgi:hypothetical protein